METLHGGYTLSICEGAFPLSTDSIALAGFVRLPKNARVLDLGSGCGTLGLLLCASDPGCHVTGVELRQEDHLQAQENIRANRLEGRMESICDDLKHADRLFSPGSFEICVSNPPYFAAGPASQTVPAARREDHCSLAELCAAAGWALKYGGDFYIVHRPERMAELFACASPHKLEPKRLCLLRHTQDKPVSLILVQLRKGAKPGLIWEELCLFDSHGNPTEQYKKLYHL